MMEFPTFPTLELLLATRTICYSNTNGKVENEILAKKRSMLFNRLNERRLIVIKPKWNHYCVKEIQEKRVGNFHYFSHPSIEMVNVEEKMTKSQGRSPKFEQGEAELIHGEKCKISRS